MHKITVVWLSLLIQASLSAKLNSATLSEAVIFAARQYKAVGMSHYEMWQAYPDGTGKQRLAWPAGVPLFAYPSPDGRHYVFSAAWAGTATISVLTYYQRERAKDILNGADPHDSALWVIRANRTQRRRVLASDPSALLWIRPGLKLLLTGTGQLLDIVSGTDETILNSGDTLEFFSIPEGIEKGGSLLFRPPTEYAVTKRDGSYWRIHLATKTTKQVLKSSTAIQKSAGLGSPDGRKLAYVENIKEAVSVLKVINLEDGTTRTFLDKSELGEVFINHFEWSPLSDKLLVEQYGGASGGPWSTLSVVNLDTFRQQVIDNITAGTAQWSPSGRWIAYQTLPATRPLGSGNIAVWSSDIGVSDADGKAKTYLTHGPVFACLPRWILSGSQ